MKIILSFLFLSVFSLSSVAQTAWSLEQCIDYALTNNLSMKQADVQLRLANLSQSQQKASRWPSLSFSGNSGHRFGLSENPTTGTLQSSNFLSSGFSFSAGVTLFNWFSKQHSMKAFEAGTEAQKKAVQKVANDLVLNIQAAYLQTLLAKELNDLAVLQLQQTTAQVETNKKKISIGVLSDLDAAQIALQLLNDSAAFITSFEAKQKSLLQLKAVLALDAAVPFDVEAIDINTNFAEAIASFQPETLAAYSMKNLPEVQQLNLQLEGSAQKIKSAKAAILPLFSLYGSLGSNYVNIPSAQSFIYIPQQVTGSKVQVGGVSYDVVAPSYQVTGYGITPFFRQLRKNFGQHVGISVSVPLFNGKSLTTAVTREELNSMQLKLQLEKAEHDIKSVIYFTYSEVVSALSRMKLQEKIVVEAIKVFAGSQKKYNLNLLSTQDLLISRNLVEKAKTDLLLAKYELAFKLLQLKFYQSNNVK